MVRRRSLAKASPRAEEKLRTDVANIVDGCVKDALWKHEDRHASRLVFLGFFALWLTHAGLDSLGVAEREAEDFFVADIRNADALHFFPIHEKRALSPRRTEREAVVVDRVDHGGEITAAVGRDAMFGTQFHPEKSQAVGLRIIGNFLKWTP